MSTPRPYPAVQPLRCVSGSVDAAVRLPGSKSITNRALLLSALAQGESHLRAPLHSDDTLYMIQSLRALGISVREEPDGDLIVEGRGGQFDAPVQPLFVGNSGTTIRFLTAAACLTPAGTDVVLDGVARMRERPISDLLGALLTLGVGCESVNGHGCPPVRVHGGGLAGGSCRLRGDVSSQFLSAILQTAPYAKEDVQISIVGDLISKPYIDITQSVMAAFGVEIRNQDYRSLHVPSRRCYHAQEYVIEADASNASYFLAAAALTGGRVTLLNLGSRSIQGDIQFIDVLEQMGCIIERGDSLTVTGPSQLRAVDIDMQHIPDTAQTLAVLCAFADAPSRITGLASLRVKETDRIKAITTELTKLGVGVKEGPDNWIITPPLSGVSTGAVIGTYEDHRMAMSFAVAGLRVPDLVIEDPGCVAKTFPDFWTLWKDSFYHA